MKRVKWWGILAIIFVLFSLPTAAGPVAADPPDGDSGTAEDQQPPTEGVSVNPHSLPAFPRGETPGRVREKSRLYPVDAATFGRLKAQANASAKARIPGGSNDVAPAARFPALGLADGGYWNPPDGAIAVGPSSVIASVNEAFAIYSKTGTRLLGPVSLQSFFGIGDSIFDPRALFDAGNASSGGYGGGSGRFILLAATSSTRQKSSRFTLAVSRNDSPQNSTTSWCTYRLNAVTGNKSSRAFADYPALGIDGDNLYITSNQFAFGSAVFQQARLMVIPKTSVYPDTNAGSCPTATTRNFSNLTNPDGSFAFSVQPATQPDALPNRTSASSPGTMYLVNAIWANASMLSLRSVSASPGTVALNASKWVSVSSYDLSADAPQPGSSALIDTGDTRLLGAVNRFGTIYTANTTQHVASSLSANPNPYASAQWYAITPGNTATPPSALTAAVTDPGVAYFFPGIMPGCSSGGCSGHFVGLQLSGSSATQPASAFWSRDGGTPTIYQAGVGGYTLGGRWGDYPGVSADPSNPAAVWVLGEYAQSAGAWGTAIATITMP